MSKNTDAVISGMVKRGEIGAVRERLTAGDDPNAVDDDKLPLLLDAVITGGADMVRLLLENGANVRLGGRGETGGIYLHSAVLSGNPEVVRLLLAAGCDPREQFDRGGHALHTAAYAEKGDPITIARLLLGAGADPNLPIDYGTTPVHLAARSANAGMLRLFLERGGNPNVADSLGLTALHYALLHPRPASADIVGQLLDAGANPNAAADPKGESKGITALILAARYAQTQTLKRLLDGGANINTVDAAKRTALGESLISTENFAFLLTAGADISVLVDAPGKPALLSAAEGNNAVAITALQSAGADPNKVYRGRLPLLVAITKMYPVRGVVAALLAGGANPDLPDKSGKSARDIARERRIDWLLSLLESANR